MLLHGLACGQPGKPRKSSGKPRLLLQFPAISRRSEDFPVLQESLLRQPAFLLYCKKACRSFSLSFLQIFKLGVFARRASCKKHSALFRHAGKAVKRPRNSRHAGKAVKRPRNSRHAGKAIRRPRNSRGSPAYTIGCCTAEIITVLSCTLRPPACSS